MEMVVYLKNYFSKTYLPRWIVLVLDLATVLITFFLSYVFWFKYDLHTVAIYAEYRQALLIVPVYLFSFWLLKSYSGIIRFSTTRDISRIIFALSLGSFILLCISYFMRNYNLIEIHFIPYSVILVQLVFGSLVAIIARLLIKSVYNEWFNTSKTEKNVMIYGAGSLGQITSNALMLDDSYKKVKLIGFIDDNVSLQGKSAAGVPIYSSKVAFKKIIQKRNVTEIILAITKKNLPLKRKREIVELCLPKKLILKEVPTVETWINGRLDASKIKKVSIEDLLGRDTINLDCEKIIAGVKDVVILITGAAGSIGSEIVRQLIIFNAHHILLLDKAESDLYDLQNEIINKNKNVKFTAIVGDVTNEVKLRKLFKKYSPDIVINAAAYKHVPLMEDFPCEAIRVNIGGTRNLANLSLEFGVQKFVLVSTDKAVNPTSVMGTTKRISEIYVQSLAQKYGNATQFITTRFGNVLGSNGSVIPLFKKQIENGGPVTVTHHDITRFFMTIPEACQLVLEACFMGKGGEIFVFDMGEPVKIYNLAEKMIFLSGLVPHEDIKIEITNLRPGEKLYEELLIDQEGLLPTYNDKIMIGKNVEHDYDMINRQITHLLKNIDLYSNQKLVNYMQEIVPEFISANSYYTNGGSKEIENVKILS